MFDFLTVRKTLNQFGVALSSIRVEIESVQREIEDVQYAPVCIDDALQALQSWAQSNESKYREYLKKVFSTILARPGDVADKVSFSEHLKNREILPDDTARSPISRDVQLCGLLGAERFIALMRPQLEALDWSKSGPPMVERNAVLAVLERKLKVLRTKEFDLVQSAEKAGLNLS